MRVRQTPPQEWCIRGSSFRLIHDPVDPDEMNDVLHYGDDEIVMGNEVYSTDNRLLHKAGVCILGVKIRLEMLKKRHLLMQLVANCGYLGWIEMKWRLRRLWRMKGLIWCTNLEEALGQTLAVFFSL